tara:strand:- start:14774 stop:17533 length:2760 start_codon:yes stop_codon:yes gene_type:complete
MLTKNVVDDISELPNSLPFRAGSAIVTVYAAPFNLSREAMDYDIVVGMSPFGSSKVVPVLYLSEGEFVAKMEAMAVLGPVSVYSGRISSARMHSDIIRGAARTQTLAMFKSIVSKYANTAKGDTKGRNVYRKLWAKMFRKNPKFCHVMWTADWLTYSKAMGLWQLSTKETTDSERTAFLINAVPEGRELDSITPLWFQVSQGMVIQFLAGLPDSLRSMHGYAAFVRAAAGFLFAAVLSVRASSRLGSIETRAQIVTTVAESGDQSAGALQGVLDMVNFESDAAVRAIGREIAAMMVQTRDAVSAVAIVQPVLIASYNGALMDALRAASSRRRMQPSALRIGGTFFYPRPESLSDNQSRLADSGIWSKGREYDVDTTRSGAIILGTGDSTALQQIAAIAAKALCDAKGIETFADVVKIMRCRPEDLSLISHTMKEPWRFCYPDAPLEHVRHLLHLFTTAVTARLVETVGPKDSCIDFERLTDRFNDDVRAPIVPFAVYIGYMSLLPQPLPFPDDMPEGVVKGDLRGVGAMDDQYPMWTLPPSFELSGADQLLSLAARAGPRGIAIEVGGGEDNAAVAKRLDKLKCCLVMRFNGFNWNNPIQNIVHVRESDVGLIVVVHGKFATKDAATCFLHGVAASPACAAAMMIALSSTLAKPNCVQDHRPLQVLHEAAPIVAAAADRPDAFWMCMLTLVWKMRYMRYHLADCATCRRNVTAFFAASGGPCKMPNPYSVHNEDAVHVHGWSRLLYFSGASTAWTPAIDQFVRWLGELEGTNSPAIGLQHFDLELPLGGPYALLRASLSDDAATDFNQLAGSRTVGRVDPRLESRVLRAYMESRVPVAFLQVCATLWNSLYLAGMRDVLPALPEEIICAITTLVCVDAWCCLPPDAGTVHGWSVQVQKEWIQKLTSSKCAVVTLSNSGW